MQSVNKVAVWFYYQTEKRKVSQRTIEYVTGRLHDDVIYLLQPERFWVFFICANKGFKFII